MNAASAAAFAARFPAPRAGAADQRVLEYLSTHANHEALTPRLPHKTLGRFFGRHERKIQEIMRRLAARGAIQIEALSGYANAYRVMFDWVKRRREREQPTPDKVAALEPESAPAPDSIAILWHPHLEHHPRL